MTDELCPQFGIIGAACSDPENICDQYVFCKRARELQKEPDTLPQWAIDKLNRFIANSSMPDSEWFNEWKECCKWVLTLQKPEEKE